MIKKITISSRKSRNPSSILGVHIVLLVPWSLVIDSVCVKSSYLLKDKMAGRGIAQVSKNSAQVITQVTSTKTLGKSRISSGLNEFEQAKTQQSEALEPCLNKHDMLEKAPLLSDKHVPVLLLRFAHCTRSYRCSNEHMTSSFEYRQSQGVFLL